MFTTPSPLRPRRFFQKRDEILPVALLLQPREHHLGARNVLHSGERHAQESGVRSPMSAARARNLSLQSDTVLYLQGFHTNKSTLISVFFVFFAFYSY